MSIKALVIDLNRRHRQELIERRDAASRWAHEGVMAGDAVVELATVDLIVDFFPDRLEYRTRLGDLHHVLTYDRILRVALKKRASAAINIGDRALFETRKQSASRMVLTIESRRRPLVFDFRSQPLERVREAAELIRRRLRTRADGGSYDDDTPSFLSPIMVSRADEIAKLATLRSQGILSDDEFEAEKARILNS